MKPNRFLTNAAGILFVLSAFAAAGVANAAGKKVEEQKESEKAEMVEQGKDHEVRLSNLSRKPLTIIGIQVSGKDSGDFSQTNNCKSRLEERESCVIKVAFSPKTAGEKIATLEVRTSLGTKGVTLTGTGK